jgi:hypothetical protein
MPINDNDFEKNMLETRNGFDKLHWYMTFFSGTVLTLLFNFIKDISPITDYTVSVLFRITIALLFIIMVVSPIRNYISYFITSLFSQSLRAYKQKDNENYVKYHNQAATLTLIRAIASYISILSCITVLMLLYLIINKLYLS